MLSSSFNSRSYSQVWLAVALLCFGFCSADALPAGSLDVVTLHDETSIMGTVEKLDEKKITILLSSGKRKEIFREKVKRIEFALRTEASSPPFKVELKAVGANDSADVFLNGSLIFQDVRSQQEWVDVTDEIKSGNNDIRLLMRNERASWAYSLTLRVNGRAIPIRCGSPSSSVGCNCCGFSGNETGEFELPPIWIWVDRAKGRAELID